MVGYYFDEHIARRIADQLVEKGIKVTLAVDAGQEGKSDPEHLAHAAEHGLIMVTFDRPFTGKTMSSTDHAGLICWTGPLDDFGGVIRALIDFAEKHSPESCAGRVFWLK